MDFLAPFFNHILDFLTYANTSINDFLDFLHNGIYDFVTKAFAAFLIWSTVAYIDFMIYMIGFSWDVAQSVLSQLNVSAALNAAWSSLESSIASFVSLLNIPDAINVILSARVTRFVLNFMGL